MHFHPLVPSFILQQDALETHAGSFSGATQFVDISGFTALTEKLMLHGKEGAEVLAQTLQHNFNPLVEAVEQAGGFITGFAGDAFTAVYPQRDEQPNQLIATRALRAAWDMQEFFSKHGQVETQYGTFDFAVKIGLSWGTIDWEILTTPQATPTYYFRGQGIDGCAHSEKYANKGDILLDHRFLQQLPPSQTERIQPNYVRSLEAPQEPLPILPPLPQTHTPNRFVPTEIANFPKTGEFRHVTVIFLSFGEIKNLLEFATQIQQSLHRFGGTFTRFDFGDKGGNLLIFFGAPTTHENNEERALDFVLQLREEYGDRIQLRGGVTQNIMYTGFNGGIRRNEFACLGRAVNLAARLMMKANWGEFWCGPRLHVRTVSKFDFNAKGSFPLKGFQQPVPIHSINNRLTDTQIQFSSIAMVGREEELKQLTQGISAIFEDRFAGIFYVDGEPGMGKSYLVASCRHSLLEDAPVPFRWIYAPTDQTFQGSLHPFVYALQAFAHQSPAQSNEDNRACFEQALQELQNQLPADATSQKRELVRVHSFLAALLGIRIPGSLYEQLEPRLRFANTISALGTWLQALCTTTPVVLQLEDAHWLDDASLQAIRRILQRLQHERLALVATSRYLSDGSKFRFEVETVQAQEVNLNQLQRKGIRAMSEAHLGEEVHETLIDLLEEKTRGNPFFVEQIVSYLQEQNALEKTEQGLAPATTGFLLPEEVSTVLIARLDRLKPKIRNIVQIASTLGREFELPILQSVAKEEDDVPQLVQAAEDEHIWSSPRLPNYLFVHALMRDAAYDMQARARLRELHRFAGEAYEKDPHPRYRELAYHFEQAGVEDKATEYLEKAGDEAREDYRNQEALEFYMRLQKYTPSQGGDARRIHLSIAQVMQVLGRIDEGLHHSELAAQALATPSPQVRYQHAFLIQMQGNFTKAREIINEALELATEQGDQEWEARCLNSLGVLSLYSAEIEDAGKQLERSLAISRNANIPKLEVKVISNMAGVAMARKDLEAAQNYLERSINLARELKDKWTEFLALGNLGELHLQTNNDGEAISVLEQSKATGDQIGSQNAAFLSHQAEALRRLERLEEATIIMEQAERLARSSGNAKHIIQSLLSRGHILHTQGQKQAAYENLQEALQLAKKSKQATLQTKVEQTLKLLFPTSPETLSN